MQQARVGVAFASTSCWILVFLVEMAQEERAATHGGVEVDLHRLCMHEIPRVSTREGVCRRRANAGWVEQAKGLSRWHAGAPPKNCRLSSATVDGYAWSSRLAWTRLRKAYLRLTHVFAICDAADQTDLK